MHNVDKKMRKALHWRALVQRPPFKEVEEVCRCLAVCFRDAVPRDVTVGRVLCYPHAPIAFHPEGA